MLDITDGGQSIQVHRAIDEVHVAFLQAEMVEQEFLQVPGTFVADFEANGSSIATGRELTFECMNEVTHLFVVHVEITVARYAKRITTFDLQAGIQPVYIDTNDR